MGICRSLRPQARPAYLPHHHQTEMPFDTNQLANAIAAIATMEVDEPNTDDGKDPAAVALGRKGGLKGGAARPRKLTAEHRSEIAMKAAWLIGKSLLIGLKR